MAGSQMLPIVGSFIVIGLTVIGFVLALRQFAPARTIKPIEGTGLQRAIPDTMPAAVGAGANREAMPAKPIPVRMPVGFGEIGVTGAAEQLISRGTTRALFLSPEGDEAAASAVLVSREIADAGFHVLLLDLTATGAAASPMLEDDRLAGITDLLTGEAQFTEVIHSDLYSEAHVIPAGNADLATAMRAIERLPLILDALVTAYDLVVVECGPADAASIQRLMGEGAEIMISVLEPHDPCIAVTVAALETAGHRRFSLVSPAGYEPNPVSAGRNAA